MNQFQLNYAGKSLVLNLIFMISFSLCIGLPLFWNGHFFFNSYLIHLTLKYCFFSKIISFTKARFKSVASWFFLLPPPPPPCNENGFVSFFRVSRCVDKFVYPSSFSETMLMSELLSKNKKSILGWPLSSGRDQIQ